jgi:hypothetical protein
LPVGGVVAGNAVDIQFGGHSLVDLAQEGEEFLVPVARLACCQHRTVENDARPVACARTTVGLLRQKAYHMQTTKSTINSKKIL